MQMVAATKIDVRWIRPVARGRTLFGSLVPYGSVWTPSADSAMRISFSTGVKVNGQSLPAGTYSVWAIPDSAQWTIIFNKRGTVFHLRSYVERDDALRVSAKVESLPHMETLNASFPTVEGRKATFRIQWGTTAVSLEIEAPQSGALGPDRCESSFSHG
jgi:hypothetical protein